jgi:hypothetical protein
MTGFGASLDFLRPKLNIETLFFFFGSSAEKSDGFAGRGAASVFDFFLVRAAEKRFKAPPFA